MFWQGALLNRKHAVTLSLFLIAALHSMVFAIFQLPNHFLMGSDSSSLTFISKSILYAVAVASSLINPYWGRKLGLKNTLYMGLFCNILGILTLMFHQLVILNVLFFGIALTSVINSLVTYLILVFPKKVGLGVVVLFAFLNIGLMLAPLFVDLFVQLGATRFAYPFLLGALALSLWFIRSRFPNPQIPPHLAHLKQGTLIWKELHYRLAFYLIAIICYGLTETSFSLWGITLMNDLLGAKLAQETAPFFWLSMVLSQFALLIPLYFYKSIRVLIPLVFIVVGAAYLFPLQTSAAGFIMALGLAGLGCSAIFPLLLSMMERELLAFKAKKELLHYIEVGIAVMLAGYFIGVGSVDLWVEKEGVVPPFSIGIYFHLAILFISVTGVLAYFLYLTGPQEE